MGFFSNLFKSGFDDPKPMSNEHLLSAIAGQADWLDKMVRSPIESQNSPSIVELARKRRNYIAQLCVEVITRGEESGGEKYPGATKAINVFSETTEYAKELESKEISKNNSAVRAVKEVLFKGNGVNYIANWDVSE